MSKPHIHDNPSGDPTLGWIVCEIYFFDNGAVYGKVLMQGGETECEDYVKEITSRPQTTMIDIPIPLTKHRIIDAYFQVIAIKKTSEIYKVVNFPPKIV